MRFRKTKIKGVYIIQIEPKKDKRGDFRRIFCQEELARIGIKFNMRQINQSFNRKRGTLRGMHFQKEPKTEQRIIQCLRGRIYDAAVDLRKGSPTRGQWLAVELSGKNKKMLYVPEGLAHGFQTLTNDCEIQYFMSEFYSSKRSWGIRWNDPFFKIKWPIKNPVLSRKDKNWPLIKK